MHSVVLVDRSVSAAASRLNPTSTTYLHIVHSVSAPPRVSGPPADLSGRGPFVVRSWSGPGLVVVRSRPVPDTVEYHEVHPPGGVEFRASLTLGGV